VQQLGVFFEGRRVGTVSEDAGRFAFEYAPPWLSEQASFAISRSLPLRPGPLEVPAAHAFFANLLPEGRIRTLVARRLGISVDNDFALLAALGGECAGALVVAAAVPKPSKHDWRVLDSKELERLSSDGAAFVEAVAGGGVRLSLAGAQDKLPVKFHQGRLFLPLDSAPSSHILKFASRDYKHLPENEAFVLALARACELPVVAAELYSVGKAKHLLLARYDRLVDGDGAIRRLHQEDMCQALGLPPGRKYQEEGGPSFERCFRVVADASVEPALDTRALLRWLVFNALAGNADGHAKNLSLLRSLDGSVRLAPFYDLLCTAAYPSIATRLAMKIGERDDPGQIRGRDWRLLVETIGVGSAFMVETVRTLTHEIPERARAVASELRERHGKLPAAEMILPLLQKRCRRAQQLLRQ
jgi:serine/threonine-protein kinase HipA